MKNSPLTLLKKLGMPFEMMPAKAFCSNGERWYFVTPRMPTPPVSGSCPKPLPNRIRDVLIVNDFGERSNDTATMTDTVNLQGTKIWLPQHRVYTRGNYIAELTTLGATTNLKANRLLFKIVKQIIHII